MSAVIDDVAAVREFNRFYTKLIGVLEDGLVQTPHTLAEARVLFELAQHDELEVGELRRELALDPGYLSRLLGKLDGAGLTERTRSESDARCQVVRLTRKGKSAFGVLNQHTIDQIDGLITPLSTADRGRLRAAMRTISELLGEDSKDLRSYVIRDLKPGDLGWVISRNGALYAEQYGWDHTYEELVTCIVGEFVRDRDPKRERAWIAELDGEPVGCVFCVREDETTARLRLLLVEPRARGLGIGARLVDEVLDFARHTGYQRIVLWTNDVLSSARRIYQRAGFELVGEDRHTSFGKKLVGQDWARDL
jgi:DNA-binding MarR family transcriptional regulator/GNAT superfamily N-acetyltransferase